MKQEHLCECQLAHELVHQICAANVDAVRGAACKLGVRRWARRHLGSSALAVPRVKVRVVTVHAAPLAAHGNPRHDATMARIKLVDVSIRDGNQSIWSATGLNTAQTLQIAPLLERMGLQAIDFSSSTHMGIAVRTHKENPWELLRAMRAATPTTPLQFITTGFRFISWETSSPEFMRLAYRCLVRNGIGRFALIDPMHDLPAFLEAAHIIHSEGGEVLGGLTYTISEVHDDAFYAHFAETIAASPHVSRLYIKDPTGLLTPERARTLIPAVRARIGT